MPKRIGVRTLTQADLDAISDGVKGRPRRTPDRTRHPERSAVLGTPDALAGTRLIADNGAHEWTDRTMSGDRGPWSWPQLEGRIQRARSEWKVRTGAALHDPGIALAELLALVADLLSEYAERLANDAYLGSARDGWSAGRRARAVLEVGIEVDGRPWRQVSNLDGSAPGDHHFVVRRRDDGATLIEFGDGVHGQRPSSGSSIGVRYGRGGRYSPVLLQQGRVTIDTDWGEAPSVMACGIYRATVLDNADSLVQRRLRVQVPSVSGDEAMWALACLPPGGSDGIPSIGDGVWVAFESCDPSRPVWLGRLAVS